MLGSLMCILGWRISGYWLVLHLEELLRGKGVGVGAGWRGGVTRIMVPVPSTSYLIAGEGWGVWGGPQHLLPHHALHVPHGDLVVPVHR